jgi:hypothetical protein
MFTVNSISSSCAPTFLAEAFKPEFFQLRAEEPRASDPGQGGDARPRTRYCEDTHRTHAEFCAGPDFILYQQEVWRNLDLLANFCRSHGMPDANRIAARFNRFYGHRFHQQYFDRYVEVVDSQGKQSLDNFCDMIRDVRIPLHRKRAAIRNLSEGVLVCASGVTANLINADRDLALSTQGIRATLWKAKEDFVRGDLLEAMSAAFSGKPGYKGNEIHYVSAAWNYIADSVGLPIIPDADARILELSFLNDCQRKILDAMTPDRFACFIAEQLLGMFVSSLARRGRGSSGPCSVRVNDAFQEILKGIQLERQLQPEALGLHAFVRLDDSGEHYEVRRDPSLIARDLLSLMHEEGLVNAAPVNCGKWIDSNGLSCALYIYGSGLAWRAVPSATPPGVSAWDAGQDAELLTISDLRAWCGTWLPGGEAPPAVALRQAIHGAEPQDLDDIPVSWLDDSQFTLALLDKLSGGNADRFLQANLQYFLTVFPVEDRDHLIDMHFGSGPAILTMARHWYPSPWALMGLDAPSDRSRLQHWMACGNWRAIDALWCETDGRRYLDTGLYVFDEMIVDVLTGSAKRPILYEAMAKGFTQAIAAWHRLLSDPTVTGRIGRRLPEILAGKGGDGCAALTMALHEGHAGAIGAFHRLVADPAITPHIRRKLPGLMAALSGAGAPGLLHAMELGNADAIKAFHAMLVDPAVFPHIEHSMASLLIAQTSTGTTALVQAMLLGKGGAIRAYHAMLIDARVLPYTIHSLSRLLNAERADGKSGLAASLDKGNADAIKAFHELLADPLLAPHIARLKLLPKLLAARTPIGYPGLAFALEKGRTDAIKAFHGLLTDPAILPHVKRVLPKLLAAKRRDGNPGLLLALRNNHPAAIEAFGDMLEDPLILPSIRHAMAKLVVARDASGLPASSWGIWTEQSAAIAAFRAMVARPGIAAVLEDGLTGEPGARNATQTSATGATRVAAVAIDSQVPTTVGGSLALLAQRIIRGAAQRLAGPWHRTP